ncbi:ddb1 and cul4 associated factor 7 [Chytriomyces hyalinus]|nr:ddb1 and cul4 associated factor 7 [Chytriomyces hyalinus]KAJ3249896.1 ddb1 and cul4 associated factor 7 [Chytriomyces hyalinus]
MSTAKHSTGSTNTTNKSHVIEYRSKFNVYALAWRQTRAEFGLAIGSCDEAASSHVEVVEKRPGSESQMRCVARADFEYPVTKLLWAPEKAQSSLVCSTSDLLRVHELVESGEGKALPLRGTLKQNPHQKKSSMFSPPLTSFDWSEVDPAVLVTSSIDTTCSVWDMNRLEQKTQLIAHDKAVYDVCFSRNPDIFGSVGADGSLRTFDLRSLEHSTILYETTSRLVSATQTMESQALLRIAWNRLDSNYIAVFGEGGSDASGAGKVVVVDVRVPSVALLELSGHRMRKQEVGAGASKGGSKNATIAGGVNAIAWAPHSSAHLCTVGEDAYALVWDLSKAAPRTVLDAPLLTYIANEPINNVSWTPGNQDWIGIAAGKTVQALKV